MTITENVIDNHWERKSTWIFTNQNINHQRDHRISQNLMFIGFELSMGSTATFKLRPFTIEMLLTFYSKIAEQQMVCQNLKNEILHQAELLICPILI